MIGIRSVFALGRAGVFSHGSSRMMSGVSLSQRGVSVAAPLVCSPTSQTSLMNKRFSGDSKKELESFTANLFCGKMRTDQCFPYPETLTEDDHEMLPIIVDSTDKFFNEKNDALQNDLTKVVPDEIMDGLKELGAFGIQVPSSYGGVGLKNTGYARLTEVVGRYDLAVGIVMGAHQSIGFKGILLDGNDAQKAKYLPALATGENIAAFCLTEPSSGSDAQSIRTRAVENADGSWTINGGKIWISNGGIAEIFTVFAQTEVIDPKSGEKRDKVTAFIVERAFGGVTHGPPEDKMGIKASNTAEVNFENVVVPKENVLGEVGGGFKVAMRILNNGRFGMGSTLSGTCKKLIETANAHANERKQFGKHIKEFGLIKEKIALMTMQTYALESMAYLVSQIMDSGSDDYQLEAAICKIYGTETATFVADECLQILGGMGYMRETGVEKVVRDLRIFRIFEGTNEILRMLVALTGCQQAGKSLKELAKLMSNPVSVVSNFGQVLTEVSKRAGPKVGLSPSASATIPAARELEESARIIEQCSAKFGLAVEAALMKHKKDIINEQVTLKRLADCAIQIFSMAAATSRATRAFEKDLPSKEFEGKLCNTYCKVVNDKVGVFLKELENNSAVDANVKEIGDFVLEKGYDVASPIGLEF